MSLQVLPLAITMMAGPQILSAIVFVTAPKPLRLSTYFLAGVALAVCLGVAIALALATMLGISVPLGDPSDNGSVGNVVQYLLVGLLVLLSIRNYVRRATVEPPGWLGTLMNADPTTALKTGLVLILFFPTDIIVMLTVGFNLAQNDAGLLAALPFVATTLLVAALPILFYLLFRRRAQRVMPMVRDWMSANSWAVNVIVYVVFIVLILA